MTKKNRDKSTRMQTIRKMIICLTLLAPLNVAFSNTNTPEPYSVVVAKSNVNMPTGGTITSQYSVSPKGSDISKIVDNDMKTKFVTPHTQFYILWRGNNKEPINHYSLTSANDSPAKDPKSWSLSASDDNATWTLLDKQENQSFSKRSETKEYSFENATEYKFYKLDIESNGGNASTQLAEWSMQMIWDNIEDLMQYSWWHSHSDLTPMGKFFEDKHETTDEDRIWLNDATKDAPLPEDDKRHLVHFAINLYPSKEPIITDANQYGLSNCGAVAAFSSMAYTYPEFVKSIIKDNKDNTYTISMFDPEGKPLLVSINSKFLANEKDEILGAGGKKKTPNWATVLEKAIMKYNHIYKVSRNYDLGGIGTEHALALFTGNGDSFAFAPGALGQKDLVRAAKVCLKQGKFVLGGFNVNGLRVEGGTTTTAHVYTFINSAGSNALLWMRNPWGSNPNFGDDKDGILRIPNHEAITRTVDIRIIEPGIAAQKGK